VSDDSLIGVERTRGRDRSAAKNTDSEAGGGDSKIMAFRQQSNASSANDAEASRTIRSKKN
jgi:hypothetical protein